MNVLIIENEKPASDKLIGLIKKVSPETTIEKVIETVEEAVNRLLSPPSPDLILMDIQLDDGICFEIFDTLKINTPVIFTTAFDDYLLRAFRVNSVDYILKPVKEADLDRAFKKFRELRSVISPGIIREIFPDNMRQFRSRFLIRAGAHFKSVRTEEICSFHIRERSVFMRTLTGREYGMDHSLDQITACLDPEKFYRINRNCILNISCISDMIIYSTSRLQIRLSSGIPGMDEEYLVVSRDRVAGLKDLMNK